ncbi:hypothetical protein BAE44_0019198 [Dichanthelium oligosanthes]|uniref:Uncharacterized protein n=1 Tax=Dichanthelium oligosanthes TaxID=888268 RepID=A0A1E5V470_9POAL|nr:hypothetical protein BAE44_0019198 [Dichanthelium oligosanthes]
MFLLHSGTLWLHARHKNLIGFIDLSDIAPMLHIYSLLIISCDSFTFLLKLKKIENQQIFHD